MSHLDAGYFPTRDMVRRQKKKFLATAHRAGVAIGVLKVTSSDCATRSSEASRDVCAQLRQAGQADIGEALLADSEAQHAS
jgi:hypothetical protein